ncbi:MAG: hypothetical protein GY696_18055 [Gammaproteobacteria bacterium]|nr:hypothetical protein [Gammaproteobacteria bacterium]
MTYVSAQWTAISEGLANDTCMDGLNATNPYIQAQQNLSGAPKAETAGAHAVQTVLAYAPWTPPEPARFQNQWGAQAPVRAQNQWGPGRTHAVQTMPAAPSVCQFTARLDYEGDQPCIEIQGERYSLVNSVVAEKRGGEREQAQHGQRHLGTTTTTR